MYPNDTNEYVARADAFSCVNATFVDDRFGNPQSALFLNNGFCQVKPAVFFFGGDFTVTFWIKQIQASPFARAIDFSNGYGINNVMFPVSYALNLQPMFGVIENYAGNSASSSLEVNLRLPELRLYGGISSEFHDTFFVVGNSGFFQIFSLFLNNLRIL
jgi:hypothetical protein